MNIFFGKMGSCNRFHSHPGSFKLAFCYSIYRREMTMFVRSRWQKTAADDVCRRRRRGILIMGIVFRRPRAASTASPLDNQRSKRQSRLQSAKVSQTERTFIKSGPDTKDTTCKQDLRNEAFVTLKWKHFSKPLHMLNNQTNLIVCFDQPMKSYQSGCLF